MSVREYVANTHLAAILREDFGLQAEAETGVGQRTPDIRIDRDNDAIVIECEWAPGTNVGDEAAARLGTAIGGREVRLVVALTYPHAFKTIPDSRLKGALRESRSFGVRFAEKSGLDEIQWTPRSELSVADLAQHLGDPYVSIAPDDSEINRLVSVLDDAIDRGAEILIRYPSILAEVVRVLQLDRLDIERKAQARASVLIWADALLFHDLLSKGLVGIVPRIKGELKNQTLDVWNSILETNWLPIIRPARDALNVVSSSVATDILDTLQGSVEELARSDLPRRHDLAGRVFHRLLIGGKYLSPNYTTIPSATLLAEIALGAMETDWGDKEAIKNLRVGDPSCGTGTLLVASAEAIRRQYLHHARKKGLRPAEDLNRVLIEETLWGVDVVLASVHLAAATLCMADPTRAIEKTGLHTMSLGIVNDEVRLGSLDLLRRPKTGMAYFGDQLQLGATTSIQRPTDRDRDDQSKLTSEILDLAILNPPFFKASGLTTQRDGRSTWKPVFGIMANPHDAARMRTALQHRLSRTPAKIRAGGSAFAVLADDMLENGGIMAIVLPSNVITGTDWAEMRTFWRENYNILWLFLSHDTRTRSASRSVPGRFWTSFSESTRLSEVMIVARKRDKNASEQDEDTRIVNLRHNPDNSIESIRLARSISAVLDCDIPTIDGRPGSVCRIPTANGKSVGQLIRIPSNVTQSNDMSAAISAAGAFLATELAQYAWQLAHGNLPVDESDHRIPVAPLSEIGSSGPWHSAIKGNQGPCLITDDSTADGFPALWRQTSGQVTRLLARPDARLTAKTSREEEFQRLRLAASRLNIATEPRLAPQNVLAVLTKEPSLGVASWNSVRLHSRRRGEEETLALWLNSTLGVLIRIAWGNRPYLGRSRLTITALQKLPVLDVAALDPVQLDAGLQLWRRVRAQELGTFSEIASDPLRREIDHGLVLEILNLPPGAARQIDRLRSQLGPEPMMQCRA